MSLNFGAITTGVQTVTATGPVVPTAGLSVATAPATTSDFTVFCEVIPSSTLIENINFLETVPQYREWIDERALQAIGASYQYSVTNKHWEVSIQINRDTVFDNRLHRHVCVLTYCLVWGLVLLEKWNRQTLFELPARPPTS